VVSALNAMAGEATKPLGQIHALWTLEGLGALNVEVITTALDSKDAYVLETAIRLSELLPPNEMGNLLPKFQALSIPPVMVVRRQLAASLGKIPGDNALWLLKEVLLANIEQPYFREAAIHGLAGREQRFKEIVGPDLADAKLNAYLAECLRPKTTAAAFSLPRDKAHLASFERGETLFIAHCMACHGADGEGTENLGPPLAGSEWVTGSHKRISAIMLQGLMGPIRVAGKDYTPAAPMPGFKVNPELKDADFADIATFIRHAWGNGKDAVTPATIAEVRSGLSDRQTVFTPEEIEKEYP
jgi:mono/diheme cytochrome c family protein